MLNQRWTRIAHDIRGLYQQLDEEAQAFAAQSGVHCPPGCGACCLSPHVETTVAEMLPLALLLFERDAVEATLDKLQQGSPLCVQYQPEPGQPERGRCLSYAERPVLCRLFGFVGSRDKSGQPRYAGCRVLQKVEAARITAVNEALKAGTLSIPWLAPAHERVAEIGGELGTEMLPINRALLRAIEIVGLSLQLQENDQDMSC